MDESTNGVPGVPLNVGRVLEFKGEKRLLLVDLMSGWEALSIGEWYYTLLMSSGREGDRVVASQLKHALLECAERMRKRDADTM